MRKFGRQLITILAVALLCGSLTAATTVATAAADECGVRFCEPMPDPDPGDPEPDPGGGGGGGTPPPTTCSAPVVSTYTSTTSYTPDCGTGHRLHAEAYLLRWEGLSGGNPASSARMQSYSRFERSSDGDRVDASYLRVACSDNYGRSDGDHESNASKTTVSYNTGVVPPGAPVVVTCEHQATYAGVSYSATTITTLFAPHPY